jgi:teichuronic acid biosynthesis glycosyltransferase TuaG
MPAKNAESFIYESIASVREQSHTNWELIIVDDCSTDLTPEILNEAANADPRIHALKHAKPRGAAAARNTALDVANGTYIAFIDADDTWHTRKLEEQLRFMQAKDIRFSCTDFDVITFEGLVIGTRQCPKQATKTDLLLGNTIGTSTVMMSHETLGTQRFPPLTRRQDFALWLRILAAGEVCYGLNAPLTQYRRHEGSLSASRIKAALSTWAVYKTLPELSVMRAIWSYLNYLIRTSIKHVATRY